MAKKTIITKLNSHSAVYQSILSIALMSVIPLLSTVYFGIEHPPPYLQGFIFSAVFILAVAGFLIFLKFPRNIIRLRQHIAYVASGIFPDNIRLVDSCDSDDLKYIEKGLNKVIQRLQEKINIAEHQQSVERELRKTNERQQKTLIYAEKQRAMIQSLGAACHHIGQPAAILSMRLHLMKQIHDSFEELVQIDECERDLQAIIAVLNRLRMVSEFRTEPYIQNADGEEIEILAV